MAGLLKKVFGLKSDTKKMFSLATYNVHGWTDAEDSDNFERVVALVKKHNPDFLCLQETYTSMDKLFSQTTDYKHCLSSGNCAIFSKRPITYFNGSDKGKTYSRVRYVTAEIGLDNCSKFYLTCLHLYHRTEPVRLDEIRSLHTELSELFSNQKGQIWTGDFNALTREDYSDQYWHDIDQVRRRNEWEPPLVELTGQVKEYGFTDAWTTVGQPKPVKTCRFDTRIDYVYLNDEMLNQWKISDVKHIDDKASDHNMVLAKFSLKK